MGGLGAEKVVDEFVTEGVEGDETLVVEIEEVLTSITG